MKRTVQFSQKLKELGLLVGQQVSRKTPEGNEVPVANYVAVDSDKLNDLGDAVVRELFGQGFLAGIFAHLFSLENWQVVIQRLNARETSSAG
jgi:hypothetical protein